MIVLREAASDKSWRVRYMVADKIVEASYCFPFPGYVCACTFTSMHAWMYVCVGVCIAWALLFCLYMCMYLSGIYVI